MNLASQSKVDGLVTVVAAVVLAAAKGQKNSAREREKEPEGRERERLREMHLLSNLQTKMCIKIYDEFKSKMGDGLRDRSGLRKSTNKKYKHMRISAVRMTKKYPVNKCEMHSIITVNIFMGRMIMR